VVKRVSDVTVVAEVNMAFKGNAQLNYNFSFFSFMLCYHITTYVGEIKLYYILTSFYAPVQMTGDWQY